MRNSVFYIVILGACPAVWVGMFQLALYNPVIQIAHPKIIASWQFPDVDLSKMSIDDRNSKEGKNKVKKKRFITDTQ